MPTPLARQAHCTEMAGDMLAWDGRGPKC
jgi:hypothetical protein